MRSSALVRLMAAMSALAFSAAANATTQIDFSGSTHPGSTLVAVGLPVTGSFSFDASTILSSFIDTADGFSEFVTPGSAQFTVDGQTYTYSLTGIFVNDTGDIVFDFANGIDLLHILEMTSNTDISAPPAASLLTGTAFINACFPATAGDCPPTGDGPAGFIVAEALPAVPEPATWAMMLLGFAGIGFQLRRARRPALALIG